MADTKISALTAVSAVAGTNEFAVNEAGVSKKASATQLETYLKTVGMPRVKALAADHDISSTTATEVTGLGPMTLEAGTYTFKYSLVVRSATTTVGLGLGINFTGTATRAVFTERYVNTLGTGQNNTIATDSTLSTPTLHEGVAERTFSTTAPNMLNTGGIQATGTDALVVIEGVIVVTASGDLELWHSSETATSTTVMAGSSLVVTRTA